MYRGWRLIEETAEPEGGVMARCGAAPGSKNCRPDAGPLTDRSGKGRIYTWLQDAPSAILDVAACLGRSQPSSQQLTAADNAVLTVGHRRPDRSSRWVLHRQMMHGAPG